MQTFLPYPNFFDCAVCLDTKRLGKQRVECFQILNTLTGKSKGWSSHPAVTMWRGYEQCLMEYTNVMILEWVSRGYRNTMFTYAVAHGCSKRPPWLGDHKLHSSHRAALLYKLYDHYSQFNWVEAPKLDYVWPV